MNIIIFGTGTIYKEQIDKVQDSIVTLADNSKYKIGTIIDGKEVISPNDIYRYSYDIIVVMARDKQDIENQLVELGIKKKYIWHWRKYFAYSKDIQVVKYKTKEAEQCDYKRKRVLIASTEMNFSGSVIVAMYAGEILLDAGFKVSVIAPYVEKEVADRFILKGIEVIEYSILRYTKYDELINICDFDFLLANTFTMKSVVESVSGKKPVLWWIHEASDIYKSYIQEFGISKTKNYDKVIIKAVSNIAKNNFNKCYMDILKEIMPYGIPDINMESHYDKKSNYVKFAVIGGLCENKSQEDVIEAFIKLQCYYGDLIKLYVVGNYSNLYGLQIVKKYKDNNGVKFMGELNRKQIFDIYKEVDAVICASKEDCLPVVMTEAMMCEKVIICSDGTGTAEVIRNGVDGFIFQKGNIKELFDICKYVIENREDVKIISKNGKKVFKKIFSMDSFKNRLLEALDEASNFVV